MPVFFWNDPDGDAPARELLRRCTPASGATATGSRSPSAAPRSSSGRSDSTINRGGVRMGTSEIYRAVLALDEIVDALVVDLDDYMPLFVVLREGATLDDDLDQADRASGSARTARRATCRTRCARSPRSRGRCRARCSRCRSSGSSWARRPTRPRSATRSPTRAALDPFVALAGSVQPAGVTSTRRLIVSWPGIEQKRRHCPAVSVALARDRRLARRAARRPRAPRAAGATPSAQRLCSAAVDVAELERARVPGRDARAREAAGGTRRRRPRR